MSGSMTGSPQYLGIEPIRRGTPAACIQDIITVHFPDAKTVWDCRWGTGRLWQWSHHLTVYGMDRDPASTARIRADAHAIPCQSLAVDLACFDLIPIGPPDPDGPLFRVVEELARIARMGLILMGQDLVYDVGPDWWSILMITGIHNRLGIWPRDLVMQHSNRRFWTRPSRVRRARTYYAIYRWL